MFQTTGPTSSRTPRKRIRRTERMDTIYETIYEKARPYLDTRHNDVHISLSYDFARRLLPHYPDANEDIVLPAILLHDVGWKMVPEERQLDCFGPTINDAEMRRFHEAEGVRITGEILDALGWDSARIRQIVAIIDGHDTREEALSLNDRLVKDADKLWRYTPTGVDIDHQRFGIDRGPYMDYLETMVERWFFTPEAKEMAVKALAEARQGSAKS